MPFGLSSSRSSKSNGSTKVGSLSDAESGRMNMSGILHDGIRKGSSKSRKSPIKNNSKHQQQNISQDYNSQEYHLHTPPRLNLKSSNSQHRRSPSSSKYQNDSHHNHFQHEMYSQSYSSGHDVISQSYSNHSLGSRHSSHSRHSMTSSSASGQMRHHHHQHHHHHHRRISSEPGSVHSHPTVTSRSTISDPSGHSRNGNASYHHKTTMHQQFNMAEHRDPYGETTNTRRTHHQSTITTPQRHHHNHHQPSSLPPNGSVSSFPSSPITKPTPMKNSSGASVSSFQSRGSIISYNSLAPNSARSTVSANTSVVSKDKYAIKSTKKVIDGKFSQ